MGSFITTLHLLMHHVLCRIFWWNIKSSRWLSPLPYSPDLALCDFWLFPKLKSPLKGKRFQTVDEIQENTTGQLMAIGRTVWGPKVPTLKGTEASLSCIQCFFVSSLFFNKCLRISYYMPGYLLDRPCISKVQMKFCHVVKVNYVTEIKIREKV